MRCIFALAKRPCGRQAVGLAREDERAELLIEDAFIVTIDHEGTIILMAMRVSGDCRTEVGASGCYPRARPGWHPVAS